MRKVLKLLMILPVFCLLSSGYEPANNIKANNKTINKHKPEPVARWTGTLTLEQTTILSNEAYNGTTEKKIQVSFINTLPTKFRDTDDDESTFTDNKGTGTYQEHGDITEILAKRKCISDCQGGGVAELHSVVIREWDNTYDIEAIGPPCHGTSSCTDPYESTDAAITVSNHSLTNKNVLAGTKTETGEMQGGLGTWTRTTTWNLVRVKEDDVELIVTPDNYEDWMPEPGRDEVSKGTVMTINLKLQGKNGKPLKAKAESFELTLNNTSTEPGITINYPLSPKANQLPDLRFLHLPTIESEDDDQFISVGSPDGINGKAFIGSYDGGGWTTLTVEAILKDKRHIKGHLLVPGGDEDILIPKRIPGTKIALDWSKKNGNPQDIDDKETSAGNKKNGDGLTAYEEYRGVICADKFGKLNPNRFGRLDPNKKELGILLVKPSEKKFFAEGFSWFSTASKIETILFDKNEIPDNRRINQNGKSAHDFDQFVLRIQKGNTGERDMQGNVRVAWGKTYPTYDIPARVTHIVIDVDRIHADYQRHIKVMPNLPYTEKELLANTVAHEIGHGVHVDHHGEDRPYMEIQQITGVSDTVIYSYQRRQYLTNRPFVIQGPIGVKWNQQCGDVNCVMCYVNRSYWVFGIQGGTVLTNLPILPFGKTFCNDTKGTGINSYNYNYGNALQGNCLDQIKIRD